MIKINKNLNTYLYFDCERDSRYKKLYKKKLADLLFIEQKNSLIKNTIISLTKNFLMCFSGEKRNGKIITSPCCYR